MKWYLAKIVFKIISGEGTHMSQFDEQLRLINAANIEQALEKAYATGQSNEDMFLNEKNQLVQWKFLNVPELFEMGQFQDGMEIYSRIQEAEDGDSYQDFINAKALRISNLPRLSRANVI